MIKIVGLDLSLTSTGIAAIHPDEAGAVPAVDRIESKGRKDATLAVRAARLHDLATRIRHACAGADLVVVEGPSYGSRTGSQHDRSGLWWLTVHQLHQLAIPVAEASPSSRMKYATGKGNAAKDAVLAAVVRRYPQVEVTGNDEADALILAAMGARWIGLPIDDLPKTHLDAMTKVHWPGRTEATP